MRMREARDALCFVAFVWFWSCGNGLLSPKGVNFEVQALMGIKEALEDPLGVLGNWDYDDVDPCSWTMVTCSENLVVGLGISNQNLSGTLSPSIGNLTNLQIVLLQNNNITGPIPQEVGKLVKLKALDVSGNFLIGGVPSSLGHLKSLQYLRLNNNSLTGAFPMSLANMSTLAFLDLSYNNLSGPVPRFAAKTFNIIGNPLICAGRSEADCNGMELMPMSMNLNNTQAALPDKPKSRKALVFGLSLGCLCLIVLEFGLFIWWRQKHNKQAFFVVKDKHHEETSPALWLLHHTNRKASSLPIHVQWQCSFSSQRY